MTESSRPAARDLRRWPSDPAQFVDTTLCPACFSHLLGVVCDHCGLRLDVPAASDLLAAGTRVLDAETDRQAIISRMWAEQRARSVAAASPTAVALGGSYIGATAEGPAIPSTIGSSVPIGTTATRPATAVGPVTSGAPAHPDAPVPEVAPAPVAGGSRRSGVQVVLLALGVVLLSVAAVVFLLVAYLIATLEVRSIIIAGASILVLALSWLLRVRRLVGTAEGVAAVGVVLILLDVWIVRANGLFGTDRFDEAAYWGAALAVVAVALTGARALTGVRVPGFAAALAAPAAAFLLAFAAAPPDEPATGAWLGGLAASVAGSAAVLLRGRDERLIALIAGFAGAMLSSITAMWALPDVAWGITWAFLAVALAWAIGTIALRLGGTPAEQPGAVISAIAVGATSAVGVALGAAFELDATEATWFAPSAASTVVVVLALGARYGRRLARDAGIAAIAAATIAAMALLPAISVTLFAGFDVLVSGTAAWTIEANAVRSPAVTDSAVGAVLAPMAASAAAAAVLALIPRLRRAIALPIGLILYAGIAAAATANTLLAAVAVLGAVAVAALALAWWPLVGNAPGVRLVLAIIGIASAAAGWWASHASVALWPWIVAFVLLLAGAGRLLSIALWGPERGRWIGAAHISTATIVLIAAAIALPGWAEAAGLRFASPWSAPTFMAAAVSTAALAGLLIPARWSPADRTAAAVPLLSAAVIGTSLLAAPVIAAAIGAFAPRPFTEEPTGWTAASALAIVGVGWLRRGSAPGFRIAFAMIVPLATVFAGAGAAAMAGDASRIALGAAIGVLVVAALGLVVLPASDTLRQLYAGSVAVLVLLVAMAGLTPPAFPDVTWLVLLVLAPAPLLLAARFDDPITGSDPIRHLAWATPVLAVASVWTWFAGEGVGDVEAYTIPAALALGMVALLVIWRRPAAATVVAGRTALLATALAIAVLPSAAMAGESELRALVLVSAGAVATLVAAYLPDHLRGVPIRLLVLAGGWTAATVAAVVRGASVATGAPSDLIVEFWPVLALLVGIFAAASATRWNEVPSGSPEALFAASFAIASIPTIFAILSGEESTLRTAVLLALLGALHVGSVAVRARPVAGAATGWTALAIMLTAGGLALALGVLAPVGVVEPVDLVTGLIGSAMIVAGAIRLSRSAEVGSWSTLGPGLALVLLPALLADWTDPELWRIVTLGATAFAAVVAGAALRLQAPFALGGAVLLVHAISQLWPWISRLYQAEWWWLWLGIAGAALIAIAATYERQLMFARGVIRSFAALR